MTAPWLSIAMPLHRGEAWLAATLESVAREADPGIEIVLVDSSPNEGTIAVARRFSDRLAMTIVHRRDVTAWTENTNHAVALARAPHVAMLHQDDLWLPGRAAALRRWIAAAPDAALHLAPTAIVNGAGRRIGTWNCPLEPGTVAERTLARRLIVQNFVSVPAPLFRRDRFLAVGGLEPALWYTADWDLWLKLCQAGPVRYAAEVTTGFRVHGQSLTMTGSRTRDDFAAQMRMVVDRHSAWSGRFAGDGARALADASIAVNTALAGAAAGERRQLAGALWSLVRLGPVNLMRYLRYSRLIERVLPRLRAGLLAAS